MPDTVLIVDDETDLLHGLQRTISNEIGCRVLTSENAAEALNLIHAQPVDVVLADIRMPGMDGLALLEAVKAFDPAITVIMMTAYGTIEKAVQSIKSGAYDFIQKPFDEDRFIHMIKKGLELNRLVRENARLMRQVNHLAPFGNLEGRSRPMLAVRSSIQMLAGSDVTVLILGETGTGKDLAARMIHDLSSRRANPMVVVNCPAIPESILESELFGYRKGAFTNANTDKKGLFDEAHGGTILLDEIGDIPPSVQAKLLRVLQDKTVQPLGDTISHEVDVRIIAITNQDLARRMNEHRFREDLYYRLNVATLTMPPLREMKEDIPLLLEHFLKKVACEQNIQKKRISPEMLNELCNRDWPGNVRELENAIRGLCAMTSEPIITFDPMPASGQGASQADGRDLARPYKELKQKAIEDFTFDYLLRLLEYTQGNVSLSAQISGIKRQSLQKIIKRYKIPIDRFRR
jgi:DNA-binding NtrC family response regulator